MKLEIEISDAIAPYLSELQATGLYGETPDDVAAMLIRDAVLKCLVDDLVATRHQRDLAIAIPTEHGPRHEIELGEEAVETAMRLGESEPEDNKRAAYEPTVDASTLPPLTQAQHRVFLALRSLHAEGKKVTASELTARGGPGAYTLLTYLEKKGHAVNFGEPGLPDWRITCVGEPLVEDQRKSRSPAAEAPSAKPKPFRRFEDKRPLDPESVRGLPASHPAVREKRTLFPNRVLDPSEAKRLLVSGGNSRKIGDRVVKGVWEGMPIFTLTLEERASCPDTCYLFRECYGNAMQWPNRHRHGQELIDFLRAELVDLQDEHPDGFVVRLHVLGDFWSVDYVAAWAGFLRAFPALHVFGYTAWPRGSEIGAAIKRLTDTQWDRFAIRFSDKEPKPQGATTIFRMPEADTVAEGIVCPASIGTSDCCGTCGLCWAAPAKDKTIVFPAHGKIGGTKKPNDPKDDEPFSPEELAEQHAKAFDRSGKSREARSVEQPVPAPQPSPKAITRAARIAQQSTAFVPSGKKPVASRVLSRPESRGNDDRYQAGGPVAPVGSNIRAEIGAWLRTAGISIRVHPGDRIEVRGNTYSFVELVEFVNELRAEEGLDPFRIEENA